MDEKFGAVLLAAGSSSRMKSAKSKTLMKLCGRPVIEYSLKTLCSCEEVSQLVLVCRKEDMDEMAEIAKGLKKPVSLVSGGSDRQASAFAGVSALDESLGYILIHDGARPLVSREIVADVCRGAVETGAATAAVKSKDTCKLGEEFVESTPPREKLFAVQTPQAFRRSLYVDAIRQARASGKSYTDDCQLIEAVGGRVKLSLGDYKNIKITTPEDMSVVKALLGGEEEKIMRIGHGYDVHRLTPGRKLILGGVDIPFETGLLGHSDADVLCHAVSDALLGAAALGDIGKLFPDNAPELEGANSIVLLKRVSELLKENGWRIENIDSTVIAQRPKLSPYIQAMRENIAGACGVDVSTVSVKATTEEGMGFTGFGWGMAAHAVALIR